MTEAQITSTVEAPRAAKALRLRKFQDPLLFVEPEIPKIPIYA